MREMFYVCDETRYDDMIFIDFYNSFIHILLFVVLVSIQHYPELLVRYQPMILYFDLFLPSLTRNLHQLMLQVSFRIENVLMIIFFI